ALACRDLPYIQLLSGICAGSAHWFKHFQVQFPKAVESAARHDKLKRIGHPLPRFGTDCLSLRILKADVIVDAQQLYLKDLRREI
ncbi:MAG TPA: hypothetical protein VIG25_02265, partial [Pyrinomonadaceae bacterium]